MVLLEIDDDVYVDPEAVAMIKGIDAKSCAVFLYGQGSEHGIVVKKSALEVATEIIEELKSGTDPEDNQEADNEEDEES